MARNVLSHSLAAATRRGYKSAVNSVANFCSKYRMQLEFPISADTLCLWIADSAANLTYSSLRVYLHGIGTTHVELGYNNPLNSSPLVWRMYKAVKRLQGSHAARVRLPITTAILDKLEAHQDMSNTEGCAIRAAMWLGTCGLLRSGEFATRDKNSNVLLRSHVTFWNAQHVEVTDALAASETSYVKVRLTQSKTDPFRAGVDVVIADHRAIAALLMYIAVTPGQPASDPLFKMADNRPLTVQTLVSRMQAMLINAGIADANAYVGHSFRRGGATSLHLAGTSDSVIRVMGRWKSFAFAAYVDTPLQMLIAASRAMAMTKGKRIAFVNYDFRPWD